ncbi:MAG: DUF3187 family protein [Bdellovibrionota bacterium]
MWNGFILLTSCLLSFNFARAQTLSARPTHPISWQHMLPTGESPGWASDTWVEFEVINANYWAAPTTFTNLKTGKQLTLTADYEQTSLFVEFGKAISKKWAIAIEIPYAARHEGKTTDRFIDEFHDFFHFDNFGRPLYPFGQSIFETSTDGVRRGPYNAPSGAGNLKLKLKYWPVQGEKNTGVGFGLHIKAPIEDEEKGMTSGEVDVTAMMNAGVLIGQQSAFYTTAAVTYAKNNWMFKDWPRNEILWMIDFMFDIGLNDKWGVIFDFSFHSPLMKKKQLDIVYAGSTTKEKVYEKIASGYNSLVEVRGQQMIGLRRKFGTNNMWIFYFLEDWGPGDKDHNNDMVYSTGQPDFGLGTKIIFNF